MNETKRKADMVMLLLEFRWTWFMSFWPERILQILQTYWKNRQSLRISKISKNTLQPFQKVKIWCMKKSFTKSEQNFRKNTLKKSLKIVMIRLSKFSIKKCHFTSRNLRSISLPKISFPHCKLSNLHKRTIAFFKACFCLILLKILSKMRNYPILE